MLVQAFFEWIETAQANERAQAGATLARALLADALGHDTPEEAEAALTLLLDDPALIVRRALAVTLSESARAPRALVLALARDQAEVSALLIARSPLLTEADLVDLAGSAEGIALAALALRKHVSLRLAGAIIARGEVEAIRLLVGNPAAQIAPAHLVDVTRTFAMRADLREALLARPDLPAEARHVLMRAVAQALSGFLGEGGFLAPARLARATGEALENGVLEIAARAGTALFPFIRHLRADAALTPGLMLRSVLGGEWRFVAAALAELCELPSARVNSLIEGGTEAGIGALVRKAGLPDFAVPAMVAALSAAVRLPPGQAGPGLHLGVIRAAQGAILSADRDEALRLLALLRRYEAEAARAAARALGESLRSRATAAAPSLLLGAGPAGDMLRLNTFEETSGSDESASSPGDSPCAPPVQDCAAPDLASLIAEWRAEHAARDAAQEREATKKAA